MYSKFSLFRLKKVVFLKAQLNFLLNIYSFKCIKTQVFLRLKITFYICNLHLLDSKNHKDIFILYFANIKITKLIL